MTNVDINLKRISDYQQRLNTNQVAPGGSQGTSKAKDPGIAGPSFETLLKEQLQKNSGLQFSKHAMDRVNQRGIELTEDLLGSLNQAVEKARTKGAKDVVIIDTNKAFIVNVPNNTVITTMSQNEMKENVFTNIDSAVII